MAHTNSTASPTSARPAITRSAVILGRNVVLPSKGRLKWLGGNLGLDTPVIEDVIDEDGDLLPFSLADVLNRLDEFEGYSGKTHIRTALIERAFEAYEYGLLSSTERDAFEGFIRARIGTMTSIKAARKLAL